jgi:seryl-tRNA(Sec) selenium transferase
MNSIYDELGVRPFINAYRPLTRLGGATLPGPVIDAMRQASLQSVDLRVLQRQVGAAIAAMTGNEAAYVSCGAASGITFGSGGVHGRDRCWARRPPAQHLRAPEQRSDHASL